MTYWRLPASLILSGNLPSLGKKRNYIPIYNIVFLGEVSDFVISHLLLLLFFLKHIYEYLLYLLENSSLMKVYFSPPNTSKLSETDTS